MIMAIGHGAAAAPGGRRSMEVVDELPTLLQIRDAVRTEVEHLMGGH